MTSKDPRRPDLGGLEHELHADDAPDFIKRANERWERYASDQLSGYAKNVATFRERLARRRAGEPSQ